MQVQDDDGIIASCTYVYLIDVVIDYGAFCWNGTRQTKCCWPYEKYVLLDQLPTGLGLPPRTFYSPASTFSRSFWHLCDVLRALKRFFFTAPQYLCSFHLIEQQCFLRTHSIILFVQGFNEAFSWSLWLHGSSVHFRYLFWSIFKLSWDIPIIGT